MANDIKVKIYDFNPLYKRLFQKENSGLIRFDKIEKLEEEIDENTILILPISQLDLIDVDPRHLFEKILRNVNYAKLRQKNLFFIIIGTREQTTFMMTNVQKFISMNIFFLEPEFNKKMMERKISELVTFIVKNKYRITINPDELQKQYESGELQEEEIEADDETVEGED